MHDLSWLFMRSAPQLEQASATTELRWIRKDGASTQTVTIAARYPCFCISAKETLCIIVITTIISASIIILLVSAEIGRLGSLDMDQRDHEMHSPAPLPPPRHNLFSLGSFLRRTVPSFRVARECFSTDTVSHPPRRPRLPSSSTSLTLSVFCAQIPSSPPPPPPPLLVSFILLLLSPTSSLFALIRSCSSPPPPPALTNGCGHAPLTPGPFPRQLSRYQYSSG